MAKGDQHFSRELLQNLQLRNPVYGTQIIRWHRLVCPRGSHTIRESKGFMGEGWEQLAEV